LSFITPESETYFKSGLAKSAFHRSIYQELPLDYYIPSIQAAQKLTMELTLRRIAPKFYQAHDSFLMFYKPYEVVNTSLKRQNKAAPLWRDTIDRVVKDTRFYDLNKITQGSDELSILAATRFLLSLLRRIDFEYIHNLQRQAQGRPQTPAVAEGILKDAINASLETVQEAISEYSEGKEVAEEAVSVLVGAGGHGFTKEALSVLRFLEKPDEFRKRVRLLKFARLFYTRFLTAVPTSLVHQQLSSFYGGVNGITRMFSERQLVDILPSELVLTQLGDVGRALLAVKLAQRQLSVYQRAASVKPIIFIDKSGSMAEPFEGYRGETPKISVATGLALALHRKLDADVYLFDTEVEKVNPAKVVETLLTIEADGGTDVDPVIEEIARLGKQEYLYVIISDGITSSNEEILKKFIASGLAKRTKLILVPYASDHYNWVRVLKSFGNVYYAKDVAEFEAAVKSVLSSF